MAQPIDTQTKHFDWEGSPSFYQELFDFAPFSYLTLTEDGIIENCNLAVAKLFGLPLNKFINRRFAHFMHPDSKDNWARHCLLAKHIAGTQSCVLILLRDDSPPVTVQLNCLAKRTTDGRLLFLVSLNDITDYKQKEAALRIAAVAFETQDGIAVTDANRLLLRVNEAFTRITGYSAEDVCGNVPFFLKKNECTQDYQQPFWATVLTNGYWQGEVWEKRKSGEPYPIWLTITAVISKGESVSHYVCTFTDITAQKKAEKILLEARNRLENQVTTTKEELDKVRNETAEINTALTVLLKHQETHKTQLQQALTREVEKTILPFLNKLKGASTGRAQSSQLLDVLESNLLQLVYSYGSTNPMRAALNNLTPIETQVAALIRQGMATKAIASTLNITEGTANIHRNHIRRKLGLNGKTNNLQTYLKSLLE